MPAGGSLAQAAVDVVFNLDDAGPQLKKGLNQAGSQAEAASEEVGESISQGIMGKLRGLGDKMQGVGESISEKLGIGGKLGAVGAAVGVGAAFTNALDIQAANAKLAGQLGLTASESERYGKIAGQMYANNYGESMEDVNNALAEVTRNVGGMANASSAELQKVTGATMKVSKAFDQDVGQVSVAVGQMVKTGLAKNATEALDQLTVGFQKIPHASEDLLDTMNEYGVQFQKLGLDGTQAMGLINQMMQGGARNTDLAADALKEFSIRAVDGSATTVAGFQQIGLNAEEMGTKFGKGGKEASDALGQTITALKNVQDPVKRSQAAVALFGTQAEDLGDALYKMDPGTAVSALGQVGGAAEKMQKTMGESAQAKINKFMRQLQMLATNVIGGMLIPAVTGIVSILQSVFMPIFNAMNSAVGGNTQILQALGIALVAAGAAIGTVVGAIKLWTMAQTALNAVMAMNPVTLVIAGIAALVAGFLYLWNTSEGFRNFWIGLWNQVMTAAQPVITWFQQAWNAVVVWWQGVWQQIRVPVLTVLSIIGQVIVMQVNMWRAIFQGAFTAIQAVVGGAFTVISSIIQGAIGIITGIWRFFTSILRGDWQGAWSAIQGIVSAAWGMITGIVSGIAGAVSGILRGLGQTISGIWSAAWNGLTGIVSTAFGAIQGAVSGGINAVVGFVSSIPGRIVSALGNLGSLLLNAGKSIIDGLLNGLKSAIGGVLDFVGGIGDKIASLKGPLPYDRKLLIPHGKAIMGGLNRGLRTGMPNVEHTLKRLTREIPKTAINVKHRGGAPVPAVSGHRGYAAQRPSKQVQVSAPITVNSYAADPRIVARRTADRLAALTQG